MAIRRGAAPAAAATAAAEMLLSQKKTETVAVSLPGGENALFSLQNIEIGRDRVRCSVNQGRRRRSGCHPWRRNFCRSPVRRPRGSSWNHRRKRRRRGDGQRFAMRCGRAGDQSGAEKDDSGKTAAGFWKNTAQSGDSMWRYPSLAEKRSPKKTFNPRLGIEGGISILGTTGIVEPMSEKALVDTIKAVIDKQYAEDPECILISPGNYGRDFCREYLHLDI